MSQESAAVPLAGGTLNPVMRVGDTGFVDEALQFLGTHGPDLQSAL